MWEGRVWKKAQEYINLIPILYIQANNFYATRSEKVKIMKFQLMAEIKPSSLVWNTKQLRVIGNERAISPAADEDKLNKHFVI